MNNFLVFLGPIYQAVIPIVITVVGGVFAKYLYVADQKLQEQTSIEIGADLRNKLHAAATTALTAALSKYAGLGAVPGDPIIAAAVQNAVAEVQKLNPQTLEDLAKRSNLRNIAVSTIETIVKAKLPDVLSSIAWSTQAMNTAQGSTAPRPDAAAGALTGPAPFMPHT